MTGLRGYPLFHAVAIRILAAYACDSGQEIVRIAAPEDVAAGIDIVTSGPRPLNVKVKSDPYYGDDAARIQDRSLPFYRGVSDTLALEAVADAATRAPGWAMSSRAHELWYYRLALSAPEADVAALLSEPDEVFFAELPVAADDLVIFPMAEVTTWFSANMDRFPSRPVTTDGHSSWQRLVPRVTLFSAVDGLRPVGPVFEALHRQG